MEGQKTMKAKHELAVTCSILLIILIILTLVTEGIPWPN